MRVGRQDRASPLAARRAGGRHRHGAPGTVHRSRSDGCRKRLPRRAAGDRRRRGRLGAHEARGEEAARQPRPRHRSGSPHGQPAGRHPAADRAVARAVFRRQDHHSRRADLGAVAAGGDAAVRGAAPAEVAGPHHHLHLAFPRRRAGDLRPHHRLPQRPQGGDRSDGCADQGQRHRAHDRPRLGRNAYGRKRRADRRRRQAGRARGERAQRRRDDPRHIADAAQRRDHRRLRLHGLRPGRAGARAVRQGKPARRTADARRQAGAFPLDRGGAARRHRLSAREPAHDAVPHRAGVQEHLDRHSRPHPPHPAAGRAASGRSPTRISRTCRSARRAPTSRSAICPAATSRRWRSPNG